MEVERRVGKLASLLRACRAVKFSHGGDLTGACVLCGKKEVLVCELCRACACDLPVIAAACQSCGIPLSRAGLVCAECLQRPPAFSRCFAPFHYQDPIRARIRALKFDGDLPAARELAAWMWVRRPDRSMPQALLPVPLHRRRLVERGFNQSLELARHLGELACVPVLRGGCVRIAHTAAQSGLAALHRRRNVRGAFRAQALDGLEHVAIVDDVITTGSTVRELARTLRRQGVVEVEIWAVARATLRT